MSMSGHVETIIWPGESTTPEGHINTSGPDPFVVLSPLGRGRGAYIQFWSRTSPAEQARYLRHLAEVATRLADELDSEGDR